MQISWKTCFRVGLSVFLLYLCIFYWESVSDFLFLLLGAASPLLIGLAMAYVLNILMDFYERHYFPRRTGKKLIARTRRPVCLVGALGTMLLIIVLVVWLVIPELISCITMIVSDIPPLVEKLFSSDWIQRTLPKSVLDNISNIDWKNSVAEIVKFLRSGIGSAAEMVFSAVSSVVSSMITIFISLIFAIYMLYSKDKLQRQGQRLMHRYLHHGWQQRLHHWGEILNDCFRRYIVGQFAEAIILGVMCIVGMLICQFPYAATIGTLIGFTALVPIAGAYIGAAVGAIMIFTVSPIKALLFLVFIIVLQQIEGNLIYPKVVGQSIGLPALWVLAAVTIGGSLMGITGMLLGVPIASAIYRLLREDVNRKEDSSEDAAT